MKTIEFTRVNNDFYGNPRVVVHFVDLLTDKEYDTLSIEDGYNLAHKRALKLGGAKYRGKDFGGGFVFQSYNDSDLIKKINELVEKEGDK